jgi:hypothetical protein
LGIQGFSCLAFFLFRLRSLFVKTIFYRFGSALGLRYLKFNKNLIFKNHYSVVPPQQMMPNGAIPTAFGLAILAAQMQ